MTDQRRKRPRDLNQWAKRMVDLATGNAVEVLLTSDDIRWWQEEIQRWEATKANAAVITGLFIFISVIRIQTNLP